MKLFRIGKAETLQDFFNLYLKRHVFIRFRERTFRISFSKVSRPGAIYISGKNRVVIMPDHMYSSPVNGDNIEHFGWIVQNGIDDLVAYAPEEYREKFREIFTERYLLGTMSYEDINIAQQYVFRDGDPAFKNMLESINYTDQDGIQYIYSVVEMNTNEASS